MGSAGAVLQWVNVMVTRWACAVNGGRHDVVTVIINDCKSVSVGANVMGIMFERRQRHLNFLGIQMMMGLLMLTMRVSTGGVEKTLGVGGGSGTTLPSRRVRKDWMASNSSGGASWIPAMAAMSLIVSLMILLVAIISGTGMA